MKTTLQRLVEMILRGKNDQFKTVLKEELEERASILMEKMYKIESKNILKELQELQKNAQIQEEIVINSIKTEQILDIPSEFYMKDGEVRVINETEKQTLFKLYKNLNIDNKERMVKLLSESKESFNRVLNLAKIENKSKENQ